MNTPTLLRACLLMGIVPVLAAAGPSAGPSTEPATQPSTSGVAAIGWMVGSWTINTHWLKDGKPANPLAARNVIVWGPGKKFIMSDTFVGTPGVDERQRYHDVFQAAGAGLLGTTYALDGEVHQTSYTVDGTTLHADQPLKGPDGKPSGTILRQELQGAADGQSFRWQVWLVKDGKPSQIMDGTWVRQPK